MGLVGADTDQKHARGKHQAVVGRLTNNGKTAGKWFVGQATDKSRKPATL